MDPSTYKKSSPVGLTFFKLQSSLPPLLLSLIFRFPSFVEHDILSFDRGASAYTPISRVLASNMRQAGPQCSR